MQDSRAEVSSHSELEAELLAAEVALQRIEDGTYGRCESCGDGIGLAELERDPVRRACVACEATWRS